MATQVKLGTLAGTRERVLFFLNNLVDRGSGVERVMQGLQNLNNTEEM